MSKSILSDEKRIELMSIYRDNPSAAARDLLGVDLAPHQRVMLNSMWDCNNVIVILTRGAGKTWCDAVFAVLRALLFPGEKVGIFSSSYRQSKFVFDEISKLYDISPILRDSCEKKPTKMVDMCYLQFKSTGNKPGSVIHALPLGDGCQVADTEILTEKGFIKIGDLFTDKYEDKTWHNNSGKIWSNGLFRNMDSKFYNGKSNTKKILTKKGFTFESTLTHRYKIFDGSNIIWKTVDELSIGDKILIDKSVRWHNSDTNLTYDECYAFGAIIGDGNLTKQSGIGFASSEKDNDILNFIKLGTPFIWNKCSDGVHWWGSGGDKMKNDYLSKFGYSEENYITINKVIPKIIMNSSKEKMSAFISGLFDTDGGVYTCDKDGFTSISVCFYNTSETLIKQLQYILLHYGITANISKRKREHDNRFGKVNWNDSYELHITGKDVFIFANEIGFRLPRKKSKLEYEIKRKKRWSSIKDYEVPINKDELICFRKNHKPDIGYVNNRSYIIASNIKNKKYITKDFIRKFLSMYRNTKHQYLDKLNEFCREDIYYDTIDTIIESEAETMDVHVPDGNEYCANGFFSHNSTIRGARYFTIIGDEAAQIPREVLDVVVRGMMATSKNPMEQVRAMEEQKKLLAEGKIDKLKKLHNNKIVLSSTAYYQYNHLWSRVKGYIDIITEKAEKAAKLKKAGMEVPSELWTELRGHDLNGQIPFNIMKDENRALIAFNCEDMPDGFMNTESLEEAKREMPRYQYLMEYFGYFPPDSEGFFPMSLLDKSRKHGEFACEFSFDRNKDKDWVTIMGCDPARSGDNFAISIFKVNIKTEKIRLIRVLTYNKMTFPYMHIEIRKLRKLYDISEIAIDSGGGGQTIRDLLADPKICPPGDDIILQRDFEEHRFKNGKRILRLVEFSKYEWLSDANNNLLLGLQNGTLQIACEKGSLKSCGDFEETPEEESARREIDKTIEEMQNIIVTRTQTGRMHWDTPNKRQRKDRYSSVLIGYDQAYSYLDNINKPQSLVSGFWAQ